MCVREEKRRRLNVREINCLRGMVGVMRMDMISNDDMQIRTGMVKERKDRRFACSEVVRPKGENGLWGD